MLESRSKIEFFDFIKDDEFIDPWTALSFLRKALFHGITR